MLQRTSQGNSVYPNRTITKGIAREQLKYRRTTAHPSGSPSLFSPPAFFPFTSALRFDRLARNCSASRASRDFERSGFAFLSSLTANLLRTALRDVLPCTGDCDPCKWLAVRYTLWQLLARKLQ